MATMRENNPPMSEAHAREIMNATVEVAREVFGSNLVGAFALGSLAHGGFAPEVSDIDIALVLSEVDEQTAPLVDEVRGRIAARYTSPLASRVSIFWADEEHVRTGKRGDVRLGPVDRLDLLDSGVLLYGLDSREPGIRPSREELILAAAEFAAGKFTREYLSKTGVDLVAAGPRDASKFVLFPVRFLYTLESGNIGKNEAAANWYIESGRPSRQLVEAATAWREEGIRDPSAAAKLIDSETAGLFEEFFAAYSQAGPAVLPEALRKRFQEEVEYLRQ